MARAAVVVCSALFISACAPAPATPAATNTPGVLGATPPGSPAVPTATTAPATSTPTATTAAATATSAPTATEVTTSTPAVLGATPTGSPVAPVGQTVQVTLTEFHITLNPSTVSAGPVRFVVTNQGTVVHSFEVKGNGIDQVFPNLNPGESTTMEIDLTSGTYDTWCPIDSHKDLGMFQQLTVQ